MKKYRNRKNAKELIEWSYYLGIPTELTPSEYFDIQYAFFNDMKGSTIQENVVRFLEKYDYATIQKCGVGWSFELK